MDDSTRTRRRYLREFVLASAVGLAGCQTESDTESPTQQQTTTHETSVTTTHGRSESKDGSESTPTRTVNTFDAAHYLATGYLTDTANYEGKITDRRGRTEVIVSVPATDGSGSFVFGPPAIRVDPGTTIIWEWTGGSGAHTIKSADGMFGSGQAVSDPSHTFEHTFTESGIYRYYCRPHVALGMRGAVVVGDSPQRPNRNNSRPDLGGYLEDANGFEGEIPDMQRTPSVTVDVGAGDGFAFDPAIVHIPNSGVVTFSWTGEGGSHNVKGTDERPDSGAPVEATGPQVSFPFIEDGIYSYYCENHRERGMKGAVVVGNSYPT